MSEAQMIVHSLDNFPEEWKETTHRLNHIPTGISIWIANGVSFLEGKDGKANFTLGWIGAWRVWFAYKRWQRKQLYNLLNNSNEDMSDEMVSTITDNHPPEHG